MTLTAALTRTRRFGMKPGLETIEKVLASLGNPQDAISCIHVAGTNGKGAVCAMLDSILRAAGYRTGRYTSPHLVSLNERFWLDGVPINEATLQATFEQVLHTCDQETINSLTYFELLTVVAFVVYSHAKPNVLILETGLGGRLDATNIIKNPLVSVITRIGLDHCDWLGHTFSAIATEKAGIIKPGCPVVCGLTPPEAWTVIRETALKQNAPFYDVETNTTRTTPSEERLPFPVENKLTVVRVIDVLRDEHGFYLPPNACATGFQSVSWPGRFQHIELDGVQYLIDGAHNPPACEALVHAINVTNVVPPPYHLICGFCGDKDVNANLRLLVNGLDVHSVETVAIANPRSLSAEETAWRVQQVGCDTVTIQSSVANALSHARQCAQETGGSILVCGSLFLVGEVLLILGLMKPIQDSSISFPCEALKPEV